MPSFVVALVSALAFGCSDFLGGLASRRTEAVRVICVSYPVSAIGIGLLAALLPDASGVAGGIDTAALAVGAASGIAAGLAAWLFFLALAAGPMSVVSPITAIVGAVLPVLVGLAVGERPGPVALAGMGLALVAVLLVSVVPTDRQDAERPLTGRVVAWALGSGVAFAATFVLTDRIPAEAGLLPLVGARLGASLTAWTVAAAQRRLTPPPPVALRLAVCVGLLDVAANVAMLQAFQTGMLSVSSVIVSLYPAATVLLAVALLRERLTLAQTAGLALGAAAVTLIGAA